MAKLRRGEKTMQTARIVHLAMRVSDADQAAAFYQHTFGFRELRRLDVKNLTAIHLTDGNLYVAVVQYHSDATAESRVGRDPCIHHFGLEVDDMDATTALTKAMGCHLISPPDEIPVKVLTPDGILVEFAPTNFFRDLLGDTGEG
jgi:lactoylglutathione lyase